MAVIRSNLSIEFIIKPREDLYLEGGIRRIPRVQQGTPYPCQMQKNQNFSCLFRHYAKHNGLKKEDLVFYFVDKLLPDQTPETVHLMPQDEIWVEHRAKDESPTPMEPKNASKTLFSEQLRKVFDSGSHADVKFLAGVDREEIKAHKVILSSRSAYFQAMFREDNVMIENREGVIVTPHEPRIFRKLLEFIYTDNVEGLDVCDSDELVELMMTANEYVLDDLRIMCEKFSHRIITIDNIGKLLLLSNQHNASVLKSECAKFVKLHSAELAVNPTFRQELESNAELGLILFENTLSSADYAVASDLYVSDGDMLPSNGSSGSNKRRRISHDHTSEVDSDAANNGPLQTATTTSAAHVLGSRSVPVAGNYVAAGRRSS